MPEYMAVRKRHTLLEICRTPEIAAEVTITAAERLGVDAAIIFADLLLPFTPMGLDFEFVAGEGPVVHTPVRTLAQVQAADWSTYQGKILRLNLDGSIPRDNPVLNGVRSHIYSYGHRNPQGLAFAGNRLFDSEHGESIDDEVNLVVPGGNYGWPLIAGYQDDQSYVYANWSASSPQPCASLTFNVFNPPPSVPRQKESEAHLLNFTPPVKTFFTVPNSYDLRTLGNATAAPAGPPAKSTTRVKRATAEERISTGTSRQETSRRWTGRARPS